MTYSLLSAPCFLLPVPCSLLPKIYIFVPHEFYYCYNTHKTFEGFEMAWNSSTSSSPNTDNGQTSLHKEEFYTNLKSNSL
ncbi:hypothetical protein, partial [Moorena sp. SIO3I6]|uniref:hypothetical protein n=1 Tax=Moorena sp. SIO3I6 TaxID=2607831 RepID=UPI0013F8E8B9